MTTTAGGVRDTNRSVGEEDVKCCNVKFLIRRCVQQATYRFRPRNTGRGEKREVGERRTRNTQQNNTKKFQNSGIAFTPVKPSLLLLLFVYTHVLLTLVMVVTVVEKISRSHLLSYSVD
ncbi:hypothetical protein WUBG_08438 [Wuchereria bancrofti]|uniref:Transmembrane protein n=1 Tax=Wuchereria bancrofti TaxID=6293 RepID=J9EU52_WUCBA|nr:hypothetical protein WUBG_08438 [Wuchereria bancrofti]